MEINKNKVVTITYNLHEKDAEGEVIQTVGTNDPFLFLFGSEQVLPVFEQNLEGKQSGDEFSFELKKEDSYGERDESQVVDLQKNIFMIDGKLAEVVQLGHYVPMNDQDGNTMQGLILEITDEHIKVDFNHPMAGMDLFFTGKVIDVREASAEEQAHGHVHGHGGHHH